MLSSLNTVSLPDLRCRFFSESLLYLGSILSITAPVELVSQIEDDGICAREGNAS